MGPRYAAPAAPWPSTLHGPGCRQTGHAHTTRTDFVPRFADSPQGARPASRRPDHISPHGGASSTSRTLRARSIGVKGFSKRDPNPGGQREHKSYRLHDETSRPVPLADPGISKSQSHRWQTQATVSKERFEQYVAQTRARKSHLTSVGLYRIGTERKQERVRERNRELVNRAVRRCGGRLDYSSQFCYSGVH